jgi:hypothetical protein
MDWATFWAIFSQAQLVIHNQLDSTFEPEIAKKLKKTGATSQKLFEGTREGLVHVSKGLWDANKFRSTRVCTSKIAKYSVK